VIFYKVKKLEWFLDAVILFIMTVSKVGFKRDSDALIATLTLWLRMVKDQYASEKNLSKH